MKLIIHTLICVSKKAQGPQTDALICNIKPIANVQYHGENTKIVGVIVYFIAVWRRLFASMWLAQIL